jgi:hypothetical protein
MALTTTQMPSADLSPRSAAIVSPSFESATSKADAPGLARVLAIEAPRSPSITSFEGLVAAATWMISGARGGTATAVVATLATADGRTAGGGDGAEHAGTTHRTKKARRSIRRRRVTAALYERADTTTSHVSRFVLHRTSHTPLEGRLVS